MSKGMKIGCGVLLALAIIAFIIYLSIQGTYNNMVSKDEQVNQTWSQVQNQYQRRADLIPNLVNTVKGAAEFERGTFTDVTEARSKVTQMNVSQEILNDPQAFNRFQEAQSELGSALSRLLVTVENYPQLKANENFLQLQAQLEGTENRIAVERRRFNTAVQDYNAYIRKFPQNMFANVFGFDQKPYFEATAGAETPPAVEF